MNAILPARLVGAMKLVSRLVLWILCLAGLASFAPTVRADELPEYRLKAGFLYNFAMFTEWPAEVGPALNLCIVGNDSFGVEIDALHGKVAGGRTIAVQRNAAGQSLDNCQIVFIAASAISTLPPLLERVRGRPVLTVADSPGAARRGVALNMTIAQSKVGFEANLHAARGARLNLSSKLLRLA